MTIQPPIAGETIAVIRSYPDLVEAFRLIKARLGLSNKWCDDSTDRPDGFTDKVLGPSQNKNISPLTFSMFCQIFAVQFEMKIDTAMLAKMERHWEERSEPQVVVPDGRISKKLIEKAKPFVYREMGRAGGLKSASLPGAQQVRRKGGKSRAKKLTKQRRREIARKAGVASGIARNKTKADASRDEVSEVALSRRINLGRADDRRCAVPSGLC